MSSGEVRATVAAQEACKRMKSVVDGQLLDDIDKLNKEGQLLSNGQEWKGPRADTFQQDWAQMYKSLQSARDAVDQLRKQADEILEAIMKAGGR